MLSLETFSTKCSVFFTLVILGCSAFGPVLPAAAAEEAETTSTRERILTYLRDVLDRGGHNGGSKPVGLCMISPVSDQLIWNRTPLFIWQGFDTVGVRLDRTSPVLWADIIETPAEENFYTVFYGAEPLSEGTYDWLFFIDQSEGPVLSSPFQLMSDEDYAIHAAALETLQMELDEANTNQSEVAIARADYFISQDLPDDALQEILSVSAPSPELRITQAKLFEEFTAACEN